MTVAPNVRRAESYKGDVVEAKPLTLTEGDVIVVGALACVVPVISVRCEA